MRIFRVIPAGCPKCSSASMSYDWTRFSNFVEVPLSVICGLIPIPIGDVHFKCDCCNERFSSNSAQADFGCSTEKDRL